MGSMSSWDRFLAYAAHARRKPSFDAEERQYRIDVAERLRGFLEAARDGCVLEPAIETVFEGRFGARYYDLTARRQNEWLGAWASLDEPSLRVALSQFLEGGDPKRAITAFARSAEQADALAGVGPFPSYALAFGSLFAFVMAPESLPAIRPWLFEKLRRILGHEQARGSVAAQYEQHLAFAGVVKERLDAEGIPAADMIDVQSLIWSAALYDEFWAGDRGGFRQSGAAPTTNERSSRRHYLSIGAIYRNEADNLAEWIEFHRLVGVEHFYLYDNNSDDAHEQVLGGYVEEGIVTLYDWPLPRAPQDAAYDHCLQAHKDDSRWIAFIDIDEFLFSPTGRLLPDVLSSYEPYPGVVVNAAQFGPSGHRTRPEGLVIENYVQRQDLDEVRFVKSIVDPRRAARCRGPHYFEYDEGLSVDENCYPVRGPQTMSVSASLLRFNHYRTKSEQEMRRKTARPDAARGRYFPWPDWVFLRRDYSAVTDEEIVAYAPAVREALEKRAARLETAERASTEGLALRAQPRTTTIGLSDPAAPAPNHRPDRLEALAKQAERLERLSLRAHLELLLSRHDVSCVLDVGAYDGEYGRFLRSAGYEGWIFSFEPVGEMYERLVEATRDDERWRAFNVALGNRDETRAIKVRQNAVLSSFLDSSDYSVQELGTMTDTVRKEEVVVRSLDAHIDEWVAEIPAPRLFLKVDAQGWDLEVLHGAKSTLSRISVVQAELSVKPIYRDMPDYRETMAFLADQGFELTGTFPVIRDQNLSLIEFDCVMARAR